MRRHALKLAAFILAFGVAKLTAAEPADILRLLEPSDPQAAGAPSVAPPPAQPGPPSTPPPSAPQTSQPGPPAATPPGLANQPTVAPVSNTAGTAPQALATAGAGFTPYMMGDLPAASYVRGLVSYPGLVPVVIPAVTVTIPPQIIVGPRGNVTVIPARTVVLAPARTVFVPGTVTASVLAPQVGRGAVKIEENESPMPVDRVYMTYNFFDNIARPIAGLPRTDLHRETYGFETTLLDGNASIGVRMNSLQTTGPTSLAADDFGDVTVIAKLALLNDRDTGDVVSVGLAVTAPTGPDAILPDGSRENPTYFQPFVGFIDNWDRLFAQGFSSVIVPTDSREATLGTASLGVGYRVYKACDPCAFVNYVTPVVEGHATFAFNHRGLNQPITDLSGFPDTFVLTNGVHIGLAGRSNLALGVAVPLTGPKIFNVEAMAQLNWKF